MNILPSTGPYSIGAVALLRYADPVELDRFNALEDAVWSNTSLSPAVVESVRLRCAHLRKCASCSAVRITAATEDGFTEAQVGLLDVAESRANLSVAQQAALMLVDHFLRDPRVPESAQEIARKLGCRGVMEVLLSCAVFASSELRLALGEDRKPDANIIVERARSNSIQHSAAREWPALEVSVLDPEGTLPEVSPSLSEPVHELVRNLWSGTDLSRDLVAACTVRSTQLLGIPSDDPVQALLSPSLAVGMVDIDNVRNWPKWPRGLERNVLELAEQLWLDPSRVDEAVIDPLKAEIGIDGVIRVTWALIWIAQLQRLALVLHRQR